MEVFVIGLNGKGLMPTSPREARLLLREKKASVVRKTPFTIRLNYKTGSTCQDVKLGIDTGSQHIGVAVVSSNEVLEKSDYELRSTMEKRSLLETRKTYRRSRRYRKTRYRHPKFKPSTRREYSEKPISRHKHKTHWKKLPNSFTSSRRKGWLPPSIQSKVDMHIRIIHNYLEALPVNTRLTIETTRFDMAKFQNSKIQGAEYQQGPQYGFENLKAYVFARDNYTCQCCKKKGGQIRDDGTVVKLIMHHINFRSKAATDNPKGIATICDRCHSSEAHKPGGILYDWMVSNKKISRGLRDMTMENIVSLRLRQAFPTAYFTFGNFTKPNRETIRLSKTHANDAVAIALCQEITNGSIVGVKDTAETVLYKQIRRKKRSLHEANPRKGRKEPNRTAKRNSKNTSRVGAFSLYDKVEYNGQIGWITGFSGKSKAYVQTFDGKYLTQAGKTYKFISLSSLCILTKCNGWISTIRTKKTA